jgi:MFS family permease
LGSAADKLNSPTGLGVGNTAAWRILRANVIGMASPMLQEIFGGKLIGHPELGFNALSGDQKVAIAAIAAGFAGLLSLFNIGGRFFWASLSDYIGRKNTYYTFFLLGIALYASAPFFAQIGSKLLFVGAFCIILSMYGGGFATVPRRMTVNAKLPELLRKTFLIAVDGGSWRPKLSIRKNERITAQRTPPRLVHGCL